MKACFPLHILRHAFLADITIKELTALNHDVNAKELKAGQTIILPANKLSKRDKEILAGIGKGTYRTYPARAGETITDIISKRNITRAEVDALNPDLNLNKLSGACQLPCAVLCALSISPKHTDNT
jgi:hypothetical protein